MTEKRPLAYEYRSRVDGDEDDAASITTVAILKYGQYDEVTDFSAPPTYAKIVPDRDWEQATGRTYSRDELAAYILNLQAALDEMK